MGPTAATGITVPEARGEFCIRPAVESRGARSRELTMLKLFASLAAFAGILAGRIASSEVDWVGWRETADDAIEAGEEFCKAWKKK